MNNNTLLAFGGGALVVNTGTYGGFPAVFIKPALQRGPIGERTHERERTSLDALVADEVVMIFPTEEQTKSVADALCAVQPLAPKGGRNG